MLTQPLNRVSVEQRKEDRKIAFIVGAFCGLLCMGILLLPGRESAGTAAADRGAGRTAVPAVPTEPAAKTVPAVPSDPAQSVAPDSSPVQAPKGPSGTKVEAAKETGDDALEEPAAVR